MFIASLCLICCVSIVDGLFLAQWMYIVYRRSIIQCDHVGLRWVLGCLVLAGGASLFWLLVQIIMIFTQLLETLRHPPQL